MGAPIISLQNVSLTLKGNAGNVNIIKNISLDMISRDKKFKLEDNLINLLEDSPEIEYLINK